VIGGKWNATRCPIGIDFGGHSVKMLQLERLPAKDASDTTTPRWAVLAAAARTLPLDLPAKGRARQEAVAHAIAELLDSGGFHGRRCVSCLPADAMQYKNLRVPQMPAADLCSAIEWEAKDRLKLDTAQAILQFYAAGEVRQGEELREEVILMAAPRTMVDEHVQILNDCGLDPVAIDAVPSALARVLASPAAADAEPKLEVILDVGYFSSKVIILRNGRVMFFKLIDIGGRKLDEMVAQHLNLPLADASELRHRVQGSGQADSELFGSTRRETVERAVYEALRATVGDLSREIGLCLRYYSVTFRGQRPDKALLVGGEVHETQLAKMLAEGAGIAIEPAEPLRHADLKGFGPAMSRDGRYSDWAVAAGLSMRPESRSAGFTAGRFARRSKGVAA
jgi:type IV pilus assembly protein PilM